MVIAIIGFLLALAMVSLSNARIKSRDARRKTDLTQIAKALELYYDKHGVYPISNECGLTRSGAIVGLCFNYINNSGSIDPSIWFLGNLLVAEGFLGSAPIDPNKSGGQCQYYYYSTTDGQHFSISSILEKLSSTDSATQNITPPNYSDCRAGSYRVVR